jgi:cytochrome c-type biogenesis protein CcmH/NrfG
VVTPAAPAVDAKEVKAKLTMGRFHLGRGEYDDAIASFQEGLKLDPSSQELRQELEKTIKACKSERDTIGGNFKCGGP